MASTTLGCAWGNRGSRWLQSLIKMVTWYAALDSNGIRSDANPKQEREDDRLLTT